MDENTAAAARASAKPLTNRTLTDHATRLAVPTYDRSRLTPSVVHLGVGAFHRAHQAVYLDDLAERRISSDWGIVGVGFRRRRTKEALGPQGWLYTVLQRDAEGSDARVIGAMRDYHFAPDEPEAVLTTLADPRTRLVTLTVTGGAYKIERTSGRFLADDPEVAADAQHAGHPRTVLGYVVEALALRRRLRREPFTVMSCDNVPANGTVARRAVVSFAALRDRDLARWIDEHVAFPSSVVDRITPRTTDAVRKLVAERFGVADRWPVITEPYTQWVLEDTFSHGRPPLEEVGVRFVADVAPYELMKKRLLNGSHCALAYLGYLAGHRRTHEAIADPRFRSYVEALMDREVTPLLAQVPGIDLGEYKATLLRRFANPAIGDRLARLCSRGSVKMPSYLLPSIHDALVQGSPHALLTLAVAGWFRYLRGVDLAGEEIAIEDPIAERLRALARAGGSDPRPLLGERAVFGDLGERPELVSRLERALLELEERGPAGAIDGLLGARASLALR